MRGGGGVTELVGIKKGEVSRKPGTWGGVGGGGKEGGGRSGGRGFTILILSESDFRWDKEISTATAVRRGKKQDHCIVTFVY